MSKTKIVYGDSGKCDPYIIKRVEFDDTVFYEVYRKSAMVQWGYHWITNASTFEAAQRRMQEDYVLQIRLNEARQGGL